RWAKRSRFRRRTGRDLPAACPGRDAAHVAAEATQATEATQTAEGLRPTDEGDAGGGREADEGAEDQGTARAASCRRTRPSYPLGPGAVTRSRPRCSRRCADLPAAVSLRQSR